MVDGRLEGRQGGRPAIEFPAGRGTKRERGKGEVGLHLAI